MDSDVWFGFFSVCICLHSEIQDLEGLKGPAMWCVTVILLSLLAQMEGELEQVCIEQEDDNLGDIGDSLRKEKIQEELLEVFSWVELQFSEKTKDQICNLHTNAICLVRGHRDDQW